MLNRECSVDRETESQLQCARYTQEGPKRGRKFDTTASGSGVETPTDPTVEPIPLDDQDSVTGESNFSP